MRLEWEIRDRLVVRFNRFLWFPGFAVPFFDSSPHIVAITTASREAMQLTKQKAVKATLDIRASASPLYSTSIVLSFQIFPSDISLDSCSLPFNGIVSPAIVPDYNDLMWNL